MCSTASEMPITASAPGLASTIISMFQSGGAKMLNNNRLRPNYILDRAQHLILRRYDAVSRYNAQAASRTATSEESVNPESEPDNGQQGTHTDQEPRAGSPAAVGEQGSVKTPDLHSKRVQMWTAALLVGLCLIVVPGLILGIVTRQLPWGIALCGAIATVVSFFTGLYYHLNK